jgi:dihydroxyacetone kinase-like predicted kinase
LAAIEKANADNVIVLPNNSNIIMAAQQAAKIAECNVEVVPTKTIPQGVAAMLGYEPINDINTNLESMKAMTDTVVTGQVTYAVRDSEFDGKEIKEGNIMGLCDGKIDIVDEDIHDTTVDLVAHMMHDDAEIVTLYYGDKTSEEDANALVKELEEKYEDVDFEVYYGGQPLYYYIISVE